MVQALIQVNGSLSPQLTITPGSVVALNNVSTGGEVTYLWSIVDQPAGTADTIASTSSQSTTITCNKEGTYVIEITVNLGQGTQCTAMAVIGVPQVKSLMRIPGANEGNLADPTRGSLTSVALDLQLLDSLFADPGCIVGVAGSSGLSRGTVVRAASTTTIKSGLPGQEVVPQFLVADASVSAQVNKNLYVVEGGVNGSSTPANGTLIRVRQSGRFANLTGSPTVGASLYCSNTGTIATSPGSTSRVIGYVLAQSGSLYDAMIDGSVGPASGGSAGSPTNAPYVINGVSAALTGATNVQALTSTLGFVSASASIVPVMITGASGQSSDLFELWSSAGFLAGFESNGSLYFAPSAANITLGNPSTTSSYQSGVNWCSGDGTNAHETTLLQSSGGGLVFYFDLSAKWDWTTGIGDVLRQTLSANPGGGIYLDHTNNPTVQIGAASTGTSSISSVIFNAGNGTSAYQASFQCGSQGNGLELELYTGTHIMWGWAPNGWLIQRGAASSYQGGIGLWHTNNPIVQLGAGAGSANSNKPTLMLMSGDGTTGFQSSIAVDTSHGDRITLAHDTLANWSSNIGVAGIPSGVGLPFAFMPVGSTAGYESWVGLVSGGSTSTLFTIGTHQSAPPPEGTLSQVPALVFFSGTSTASYPSNALWEMTNGGIFRSSNATPLGRPIQGVADPQFLQDACTLRYVQMPLFEATVGGSGNLTTSSGTLVPIGLEVWVPNRFTGRTLVRFDCSVSTVGGGAIVQFAATIDGTTSSPVWQTACTTAAAAQQDSCSLQFLANTPVISTNLNGAHSSSITTLTVTSTTGFPSVGSLWVGTELIAYTGKTSTQFTGCTRGTSTTGPNITTTTASSYIGGEAVVHAYLVAIQWAVGGGQTARIDPAGSWPEHASLICQEC